MERVQADRPDSKNLLASMESDKIAAARAVAQNQELKQQLEEIQRAFVQVVKYFKNLTITVLQWIFFSICYRATINWN